ncbi:PIG-L deacetylase family protein [Cupriavidus sp. 2KB_3]|uniref:PIG-L deacetylase family protein n=1 Tax=Cupriavidus sp. 2KB_3 TaxID=3232980 RepID=UPI003F92D357
MDIPASIIVISPHLDDAVFSCGNLIAASHAAMVVTVFAGEPAPAPGVPEWDLAAGFSSGAQAVRARRQEDGRALRRLGAEPVWLDFLDGQYGAHRTAVDIAVRLGGLLSLQRRATIVAPLGVYHPDHVLVNAACMLLREAVAVDQSALAVGDVEALAPAPAPQQWLFYEDAIHRRMPGAVQSRLAGWWQEGLIAAPVHLPLSQHQYQSRKALAVEAYESQLRLFNAEQLADISVPERYWTLDPHPKPAR